ncbi:MAG TPA: pyridoxal phosphate-dependent aminotransferase [Bdellovibrionota bacterium]|jgi:aspartate aminotransferase
MFRLAGRMNGVESSPTVRLNALATEMIKAGKDVINLTAGETDFETPESVKQAAIAAIAAGKTRYTAPHGIPELRKAICEWFEREFQLKYEPKQVTVSAGVKQGLFHLMLATVGEGDEVLVPSPYWVSYPEMARIAGGNPVILPCEGKFRLDVEQLKKKLNERTRLLVLNSPNNPCGGMYSRAELEAVARALEGTQVLVASDEIYSSLVYDDAEFVSFASLSPDAFRRTITFNGLSKSHAMTGWRVGFAAGEASVIEAIGILQAQSSTHIATFVQTAAIAALLPEAMDFAPRLREMQERRDLTVRMLRTIPGLKMEVPQGAFYAFPDLSEYTAKFPGGSVALSEYLLNEAGVAVVPGKPFGHDQSIRISFAKDLKSLETGLSRLQAALQKIRR